MAGSYKEIDVAWGEGWRPDLAEFYGGGITAAFEKSPEGKEATWVEKDRVALQTAWETRGGTWNPDVESWWKTQYMRKGFTSGGLIKAISASQTPWAEETITTTPDDTIPPVTETPEISITKEQIADLLKTGTTTEEQIAEQKQIFETEWGRQREEALLEIKNLQSGRGTGRTSTEFLKDLGATGVRFAEAKAKGVLDIELKNKQLNFQNQVTALNLGLTADELSVNIWKELNSVDQNNWERQFREKVLEMGYDVELAKIEADAKASGKTLGEYILVMGSGAATGAAVGGPVGAIIGAGIGLFAAIFS